MWWPSDFVQSRVCKRVMVQLKIKANRWVAIYMLKDGLTLHCRFDSRECFLALVMGLFAMTVTWVNWFTLGRDVFLIHTQIQEGRQRGEQLERICHFCHLILSVHCTVVEMRPVIMPPSLMACQHPAGPPRQLVGFCNFPNVCIMQITLAS